MRFKLTFKPYSNFIPFNYNYWVYSLILEKISLADKEHANKIHTSKGFKFFTFSNIIIPKRKITDNGKGFKILSDSVSLFISSPNDAFIRSAISGFITNPECKIGPLKLILKDIKTLKSPNFSKGYVPIKTLSPIIATTKKEVDGKLKIYDILPSENKFYENIRKNLINKYKSFHKKEPYSLYVALRPTKSVKMVRINIKNTYHIGCMFSGILIGSKELLEFAYNCGLGEKNSMGFGMIGVVNNDRNQKHN